jgi:predicted lipid-binding transport protein (Tim44 family)
VGVGVLEGRGCGGKSNRAMDLTTILFLGLAVLVLLKLRSVLGRRTGTERPPGEHFPRRDVPQSGDKVVPLPQRGAPRPDAPPPVVDPVPDVGDRQRSAMQSPSVATALQAVMRADRSFEPDHFLSGAKAAYEMIVNAFASGDRKTLKPLLSKEVFEGFDQAITARERAGQRVESSFVGIDSAEITEAAMRAATAQVTVRFVSQLIQATRDAQGNVTEGDPTRVTEVTDVWTFARDVSSRDPNWRLIATEAA